MMSVWASTISWLLSAASLATSVALFACTNIAKHEHGKSKNTLGQVLVPLGIFYCAFVFLGGLLIVGLQPIAQEEKEITAKAETRRRVMREQGLAQPQAVPEDANADAPWFDKVKNKIKGWAKKFYARIKTCLQDHSNLLKQIVTLITEICVLGVSSAFVYFMVPDYTEPSTQKSYKGYDHHFFWSLFSFAVHSFSTIVFLRGCFFYDFVLGVTVLILIQEGTFLQKDNNIYPFPVALATGGFFIVAKAFFYYWNKKMKKEDKERLANELRGIEREMIEQAENRPGV